MGMKIFRPFSDLHRHIYGSVRYRDFATWRQSNKFDLRDWETLYSAHFGTVTRASDIDDRIYTLSHASHSGWQDFHTKYQLLNYASRFLEAPETLHDARYAADEIKYYLERQIEDQRRANLNVTESRIHLSHQYGPEINELILTETLASMKDLSEPNAVMTLALSLSRDNPFPTWQVLKKLLTTPTGHFCTGVDFCGNELAHEPEDIAEICADVHHFNRQWPRHAVALLIHAGELLKEGSVASSIRRVHTAARLGAHRIGHATILGIEPQKIPKVPRFERVASRKYQLRYDLQQRSELECRGVRIDSNFILEELCALELLDQNEFIRCAEISEAEISARQSIVVEELLARKTVVECCPTANVIIGGLDSYRDHPIGSMMAKGIKVVLATDNEGLFSTSLENELRLLEEAEVLDDDNIQILELNSRYCLSEILSGREVKSRVT